MKTVNKEDVITITIGDLFAACYDVLINKGIEHADAHNLSDDVLAGAIKKQTVLCLDCNNQVDYKTAQKHNCDMGSLG